MATQRSSPGNPREAQRIRRADMSPHDLDLSWRAALQRLRDRKPVPSALLCNKCSYVPANKVVELRAWLTQQGDRPELLKALEPGLVWDAATSTYTEADSSMRCRCELSRIARIEELERREARELMEQTQRLTDSNFPKHEDDGGPKTFANFENKPGTEESLEAAQALGQPGVAKMLLLIGVTGSGKSHLLEAVGRAWLATGASVRYEATGYMLDRLRASQGRNTEDELYDLLTWYAQIDVLLLDDLGMGRATEFGTGELTGLVDARIRDGKLTIITTNLRNPEEMKDGGWGDRLASRLFDQRTGAVRQVWSKADDYRRGV